MSESSKFVVYEKLPFPYFDIYKTENIKVDDFLCGKGFFRPRDENESWGHYIKREERALAKFCSIISGDLNNGKLMFKQMPEEYTDYQWYKKSEFPIQGGGSKFTVSIDNSLEEDVWYTRVPCYSREIIFSMFNCNDEVIKKLRNIENILELKQRENQYLKIKFWLSRTGIQKRTFFLEKLSEGESLLFAPKNSIINSADFEIFDKYGNSVGDISYGNEKTPNDKEDDREYWEVFEPLINNGYIELQKSYISQIIKHGTPKGKPRKAIAEVVLEFSINEIPEKTIIDIEEFQNSVNVISKLAKIDYNRKCDIIVGKIPHYIMLNELFDLNTFLDVESYQIITEQEIKSFKLDKISFTDDELISFWNVYRPLYCCISRGEYLQTTAFKIDKNLLYKISFKEDYVGERIIHSVYLSVYRKI